MKNPPKFVWVRLGSCALGMGFLLVFLNSRQNASLAPTGTRGMAADGKAVVALAPQQKTFISPGEPRLLANAGWTMDEIRADPAGIAAELKRQHTGRELLEKLQDIGYYIEQHGTMEDLQAFMAVTDNPSATVTMADSLAKMAKDKKDGEKLLAISKSWAGQAEEDAVNRILIRRGGELLGMDAVELLSGQRDGKPTSRETAAVLSGILQNQPDEVHHWLLSADHSGLDREGKADVLGQLNKAVPLADLLKDAATLSKGEAVDFNFLLGAVVTSVGNGDGDPRQSLDTIMAAEQLSGASKMNSVQQMVTSWSGTDIVGAAEWVNALPAGPVRDRSILGILNTIDNGRLNMPESAQWAASISDGKTRDYALRMYIKKDLPRFSPQP